MAGQHLSPRRSRLWAAGVAAAVVVVAAVAAGVVAWRSGASRSADGAGVSSGRGAAPASTTTTAPPPPLTVTSVTPANGATNVSGVTPVVVNFSAPLAPSSPMPVVSPTVPGSWQPAGPAALSFTPTVAF
ncbi:MAG TPA: Ig-like domain-containing protein, partial [Acidimicrobiales bacterium]|nr:Ig-like domain-containing protein [Acidimicrobiales bacterium]